MVLKAVVTIPGLVLKAPGNRREAWQAVARRARDQRAVVRLALLTLGADVRRDLRDAPRLRVRFVRLGGRKMDSDNLVAALKACRDEVAAVFSVDDGSDWWEWVWPGQEPSPSPGLRIEIEAAAD